MIVPIKGIVVCVGYDDLLALTLHRNARHLTEIIVPTSPEDERTRAVVARVPSARCWITDAFTRHGGKFNKGLAIESGFDALGRDGWTLIFDADIVLPSTLPLPVLDPTKLYGAPRRILDPVPTTLPPESEWGKFPMSKETGYPGYFQLFHGSCSTIARRPWYDVTYTHAGGGDGYFESRWPATQKERLPFEVLHLGPRDVNWFGRASERLDGEPIPEAGERSADMTRLLGMKGWRDAPESHINEKVQNPLLPQTGHKLG